IWMSSSGSSSPGCAKTADQRTHAHHRRAESNSRVPVGARRCPPCLGPGRGSVNQPASSNGGQLTTGWPRQQCGGAVLGQSLTGGCDHEVEAWFQFIQLRGSGHHFACGGKFAHDTALLKGKEIRMKGGERLHDTLGCCDDRIG